MVCGGLGPVPKSSPLRKKVCGWGITGPNLGCLGAGGLEVWGLWGGDGTNCRWKLAKGVNLDQNHKILPRATYFFHGEKNLICHGHFYSFTGKIFVYFATGSLQFSRAKFRSFLPRALFSLARALFRNLPRAQKFATGKKKTLKKLTSCQKPLTGSI